MGGVPLPSLDSRHVTSYIQAMIKTFADKETQQVFIKGK